MNAFESHYETKTLSVYFNFVVSPSLSLSANRFANWFIKQISMFRDDLCADVTSGKVAGNLSKQFLLNCFRLINNCRTGSEVTHAVSKIVSVEVF